ncbi:universal stress protein [Halopelagius longus]|uniref:Universal stress protein n=1 Tax=Halopelagius longus TaxID=1236180 RepID=A0A1H1BGL4_9EURY|nr:universal stress protein [Halopelagius longus]RDI70779.1 universal stress protein [Halopelagius longus]SDQ51013.1 Nucleotide-binding universal stress protein, UspA family [Halopelagius longus]
MYDRVLVPTGVSGPDADGRTVGRALDVAQRYDADLHVLRIEDPETVDAETPATDLNDVWPARDDRPAVPDRVEERAFAGGVNVVEAARRGPPTDAIETYVDEESDLVVMPERGAFCDEPYRLGGVVGRYLRESPVNVMTVRTEK